MEQPGIPADVRERVVEAATTLYEQGGKFPTVDAVRRAARVDMNAASSVMKDWRRAQTAQAAPTIVPVPEVVQQAGNVALAHVWNSAQEHANEALRAAQSAWETERAELDGMRAELADAFEQQASELADAHAAVERLRAELAESTASVASRGEELRRLHSENQELHANVEKTGARMEEVERRAADLRAELDHAHAEADRMRAELDAARATAAAEVEAANRRADAANTEIAKAQARTEALTGQMNRAQIERDEARQVAAEAREAGAKLAGQLEATQAQNAALLAAFKDGKPTDSQAVEKSTRASKTPKK